MARLLRPLPDAASPHEPRSVDPSKIAFVSLAAMANQAKPLRGVTPSRRSKVCRSGRSWFTNRALAHVRTPGGPTSPPQRLFRVARSSPNLCARPSLTRSNRRGTDPDARWCGRGGVARRPPIPISGGEPTFRGRAGNSRNRPETGTFGVPRTASSSLEAALRQTLYQRLRLGDLGHFRCRRKAFERGREDGVGVGRATGQLIEFCERKRRAEAEAARALPLRWLRPWQTPGVGRGFAFLQSGNRLARAAAVRDLTLSRRNCAAIAIDPCSNISTTTIPRTLRPTIGPPSLEVRIIT
jgi:hypothetical protein